MRYGEAEQGFYAAAAEAVRHAALATGYAGGIDEATWARCARAVGRARAAESADTSDDYVLLGAALEREVEDRAGAVLSKLADTLRDAIAFDDLVFEDDDDDEPVKPVASSAEARARLRRGLAGALEAAKVLGDTTLPDAIPVALAILDAPGRLDRMALAPVMETVHQRLAALFRAEGERAGATDGQQWIRLAEQVDDDKRLFTDWLEREGGVPGN